eukprot:12007942-Alexandrium_andersonii.AAC.2
MFGACDFDSISLTADLMGWQWYAAQRSDGEHDAETLSDDTVSEHDSFIADVDVHASPSAPSPDAFIADVDAELPTLHAQTIPEPTASTSTPRTLLGLWQLEQPGAPKI